ncbi:hypothetical protein IVB22_26505 [Bradyrhizobium sp. 190]|uniref:hypothetical protein n=1 Tax=Bradyrhizobium sp. 190 TaxID=2782658 RepID=UPI001FF948C0|nr:hypothetical protein [Bradyrhizobium sp. 190]MCK1516046.1 hypothetical protein [Bradyrhizobium sp. 190]
MFGVPKARFQDFKILSLTGQSRAAVAYLGSFGRMMDQGKAWQQRSLWAFPAVDGEQDNAYREDDDPAEESEPSGIGDHTGILEQVGWYDNQFTVMA